MATVHLPPDFREFLQWLTHHGVEVPIIDLEHLKRNKSAAGRAKDLADLEELG